MLLQAQVASYQPQELQRIDVVEHLGEKIPPDLIFTTDDNRETTLGEYLHRDKPVVLILAYYNCPMLCSMVLNGFVEAARQIPLQPGKDYTILTISIDPTETAQLAAAKKQNYVQNWGQEGLDEAWSFLVGPEQSSKALARALGFTYYYDEEKRQYAHPAVVHILTEDGTISRYLYGIQFRPNDLRLSLLEASRGKIGNTFDRILLYCYHYDPDSKGYAVMAENVMRLGGLITVSFLTLFLAALWTRSRVKKSRT